MSSTDPTRGEAPEEKIARSQPRGSTQARTTASRSRAPTSDHPTHTRTRCGSTYGAPTASDGSRAPPGGEPRARANTPGSPVRGASNWRPDTTVPRTAYPADTTPTHDTARQRGPVDEQAAASRVDTGVAAREGARKPRTSGEGEGRRHNGRGGLPGLGAVRALQLEQMTDHPLTRGTPSPAGSTTPHQVGEGSCLRHTRPHRRPTS